MSDKNLDLKMRRILKKLDDLFRAEIDLSDLRENDKDEKKDSTFYSRSLAALAIIMESSADTNQAAASITDGFDDYGIDAVFNDFSQKKLFLVQSKLRQNGLGGISEEDINKFTNGIKRIIYCDLDGCNKKLESKKPDILSALEDTEYKIETIFCHTGINEPTTAALKPMSDILKVLNDGTETIGFKIINKNDIYQFLSKNNGSETIDLDDVVLTNWGQLSEPYKAFYGVISAATVGSWFQQFGNKLFSKNIRYYKGSTDVNQGMKEVLRSEPEKFVYFNNGIKLLCSQISKKTIHGLDRNTGIFTLKGVSLVNGAQTAGSIASILAENPSAVGKANVFIHMIDLGEADEEQISKITRYTNTQNRIGPKDFAALDPQQERIKTDLSFSEIEYLYKTGASVEDPAHQVSIDEAIVAQACSLEDLSRVALVKRNIGALTEDINKPPYTQLFNSGTNSFSLVNGIRVLRLLETYLSAKQSHVEGRKRLVLIHGNRFILHLVLRDAMKLKGYSSSIIENEKLKNSLDSLFEYYSEATYSVLEEKFSDGYPANIFKNASRLKVLREGIDKKAKKIS